MSSVPFLTAGIPGSGGQVKLRCEDFEVEEVPAYLPSGEGEHLYLWVEKIDVETQAVTRALAQALGVDAREVGYAGIKDRRAVTRQLFSVPARGEEKLAAFSMPGVRLLWTKRHGNKLRTGHLNANTFMIRIREVSDAAAGLESFAVLVRRGVPNAFGAQRFGRGDNAALGKLLLKGERLPRRPDRFQRKLFLSAIQSELFNRVLASRLSDATWDRALLGDVLRKSETGGQFVCEAPEVDQPRVDAFEVSPTGPMFGPKMTRPRDTVEALEQRVLADEGLSLDDFKRGAEETQGARRPLRVRLENASAEQEGADLVLRFTLPSGSYATVILDELVKPGAS